MNLKCEKYPGGSAQYNGSEGKAGVVGNYPLCWNEVEGQNYTEDPEESDTDSDEEFVPPWLRYSNQMGDLHSNKKRTEDKGGRVAEVLVANSRTGHCFNEPGSYLA